MKRILFLDHAPIIGGAQLALAEHIRFLDKTHFEPHVAVGDSVPSMVERFADAGAVVHPFAWPRLRNLTPLRAWRTLRAVEALRCLVEELSLSVVVANTSRTAYTAAVALRSGQTPLVWWVRDFDFNRRLFRLFASKTTRIVCVSLAIRDYYAPEAGERYAVIPVGSGLHSRLADHTEAVVRRERERWGFDASHFVIGYMGRLVEGKGPQDLIDAFALLAPRFPRLRLLIVGSGKGQDGDVEPDLHRQLTQRGLEHLVRFAGFQSDEVLYYRAFDLFVLSSRYREAMPTSVIQAMMAGTPVVATATGGTAEVVIDEKTGLLVPPADPGRMAAAIQRMLIDETLRTGLTTRARAHVLEHHREETVSAEIERVYDSLTIPR